METEKSAPESAFGMCSGKEVKLPLSCDWLALTLHLVDRPCGCPAGHVWAYYSSTNVWASRWALFNEFGEKVFTLLFQPRQSIINSQAALLEVANEWLYHGLGITGVLSLLSQVVRFDVKGISRLDLAVDFNPTKRQSHIIKGLADGRYYVSGKQNRVPWFQRLTDTYYKPFWSGEVPFCQTWGHKTSDVRWKLYFKTKELRDNAKGCGFDKPYIVDMWRDIGLDERNVWRLEVSVHNCNGFEFMGEKLTFDRFMHSGSDLFQALYSSRFQVRRDQHHADRSNDRLTRFLDVGNLRDGFKVRRRDNMVEHNGRLTLLRHLCNDIKTEEVLLSDVSREAVIEAIGRVMEQDRFESYFRIVEGMEFDDWVEWLRVKAYYFGEEHIKEAGTTAAIEMAMVEAGIIDTDPLATESLMSHNKQLKIELQ